ncbi:AAA family ATPase [Campylobacter troglodytis]|uniref:AAA family ATPase n=1 Tax=Campylobacter troglodytis TaxID=654363 RepID=UPI00115883FE|nr:AAA family ATPase [Campylobacter troglodytis]TQR61424.1 ATPase [Campylobacter troglodytis]
MLKEFRIKNFKAFKDLKLNGFKKVNIFVGKANTGKTSILEALSLFLAKHPQILISLLNERSMLGDDACFENLFFDYKTNELITLESDLEKLELSPNFENQSLVISKQTAYIDRSNSYNLKNSLKFSFESKNKKSFSSSISFNKIETNQTAYNVSMNETEKRTFTSSLNSIEFIASVKNREYFNRFINNLSAVITDNEKAKELQQKIKEFALDIEDLKFVGGNKILVQQKGLQHAIDFRLLGQGFQSYIFMLVAILSDKKYIIIDEIENGLHFESIDLLLESMFQTPKDTQFFITTHNKELLKNLALKLEKQDDKIKNVALFNIYYDKENKLRGVQYNGENFVHALINGNETRG